ncbi:MAG TPA: phasin [Gammaproteobacteria bacterium]|jgi:phasin family protein|nr:phasin [Gammaproteobacteria bacterium]
MSTDNFDFTKMFQQFDVQEMTKKIQDAFNVDFSAVNEAHSKNIQMMVSANESLTAGTQALMQKQAEMFQTALQEATVAAQSLSGSGSPQEVAAKQAELMKVAYETALKNTAEISDMAKKTQDEVAEKINARVAESLEEIKDSMSKIG